MPNCFSVPREDDDDNSANRAERQKPKGWFSRLVSRIRKDKRSTNDDIQLTSEERAVLKKAKLGMNFIGMDRETRNFFVDLARTWYILPPHIQESLRDLLGRINDPESYAEITRVVKLAWAVVKNVWLYLREKKAYDICIRNIADLFSKTNCAVGGAVLGGLLAALFLGPVGGAIGAGVGAICGVWATQSFRDLLAREVFVLDKKQAIKMAYDALRVCERASDEEVNKAYVKRCNEFDASVGSDETIAELQLLQMRMTLIRVARGEARNEFQEFNEQYS